MKKLLSVILMISLILGNTMPVMATSSSVSGNEIVQEILAEDVETDMEEEISVTEEEATVEEEEMSVTEEETSAGEGVSDNNIIPEEVETQEQTPEETEGTEENLPEDTTTVSGNEISEQEELDEIYIPIIQHEMASSSTEIERPVASWTLEGLGAPSVPADGTTYWEGPILAFGDTPGQSRTWSYTDRSNVYTTYWRVVDADKALLMSDGIFINGQMIYGGTVWEDTSLYTYLNETFKNGELFNGGSINAIKGDIRIPTLDEMTNPAYGFLNSEQLSNTRVYGTQFALMPDTGEGEPYYVEQNGSITIPDEEYYPTSCGFVPTLELDMSKVCLAIDRDEVGYEVLGSGNSSDSIYQLFLQNESDFAATLPTEGKQNEYISFTVDTSGGEEYNELYTVLTSKSSGKIVAVGLVREGAGVGEKRMFIDSSIPAGNYTLTVFEAIRDDDYWGLVSAYAGTLVSTDFVVKGPSIGEFEVSYQQYGSIKLHWTMENISSSVIPKVNIYRSDNEETGYQLIQSEYPSQYKTMSYADEDDVFNENGSNKTYYYKICIVSGGVESDVFHYATNAGMHYGEIGEFQGMYFAMSGDDEGQTFTRIDELTLRPEEYKELQVVLFDEEGNLKTDLMEADNSYDTDTTSWYLCTVPVKDSADAKNSNGKLVSNTLLEIIPIDFSDEIHVGIVAHDKVEAGQVYYLMAQRNLPNQETYWAQIPLRIVAAGEDEVFDKMPSRENGIYFSADELSQAMRDDMVARKNKAVYYVNDEVFEEWVASGATNAVYDFNREREGMKPYEGDYLFWQNFDPEKLMEIVEDKWVFGSEMFCGVWWNKIESNQVFYTTQKQEKAVDTKIEQILSSGELGKIYSQYYRADGQYTPQERKIIADACCDYIYKNTTYKGTPIPQYHSAWSAIVNGIGTCQAYSLYLTRLLREFGIANKILTGTDANYHTYNIVQIDKEKDKWYYYDATGGVKYKTEGQYGRTEYQGLFLEDPKFVENYIAKIVGSTYAPQVYVYAGETEIGRYFTVQSAVEKLIEHHSLEGNENTRYRFKLMGNADYGEGSLVLPETVTYCEFDLNGYKLTARSPVSMGLDKVYNGTFYMTIGNSMDMYAPANQAGETVIENVKFKFEQGMGGFYVKPSSGQAQFIFKNVQVYESWSTELNGLVHMDEASYLETDRLTLNNENYEIPASLMATIEAKEVAMIRGYFDIGNLKETMNTVYDEVSESADIRTNSVLNIYGNVSLAAVVLNEWDYSDTPKITLNLMQITDSNGDVKTGAITFRERIWTNLMDSENTCHIVMNKQKVTVDGSGNRTEPETIKFGSGETVATVAKDTSLTPAGLFVLGEADPDEQIIRKGNKMIAARVSVKVSHTNTNSGEVVEKEYISLEDAVASLKADFAQNAGSYTISFLDDTRLNGNITVPSFVKELHLKAMGKEDIDALVELDLGGYSISTEGLVTLYNNLHVTNTSKTTAKLTTTAKNGGDGYAIRCLQTESPNVEQVSGIKLSAANGTLLLATENENQEIHEFHVVDADISAKEVKVVSGKWNLGTVSATNITNDAQAQITKVNSVTNFSNKETALLVVGSYTQNSQGTTALEADSVLVIKDSATVYNTVIGANDGGNENPKVYLYSLAKAINEAGKAEVISGTIALEGTITGAEDTAKVQFAVLANEEAISGLFAGVENLDNSALVEIAPRTKIVTTGMKNFPLDLLEVNAEFETSVYKQVYQQDKDIYVGREWISIYTKQVDGSLELIESFICWSDAAAYLETLANVSMEYVVEFLEDVEMTTALTLPAKAKGFTFKGNSDAGRIKLSYTGDLKLVNNTTFENIELVAKKYNSTTKKYVEYQSAVNVNGKVLTMKNTVADFASLTGSTAKSVVNLTDSDITIKNKVVSVGCLNMVNTGLEVGQSVEVTDTLTMSSSVLDAGSKVTLKNVVTNDANNRISYGGNSDTNILKISGNVSSADEADVEVLIQRTETNTSGETVEISETTIVRKNAIQIQVKSLEPDKYLQNKVLCNVKKAGAGWFVVGTAWKTEDEVTKRVISHGTYKKGDVIYCGEIADNVRLYSCDEREGDYALESSFATLQEAFSEIDKIALSDKYYYVQIVNDTKGVVTFGDKNLTLPSKAAKVIVEGGYIYMKDNLTLKCNTAFVNSVLVPEKEATLSIDKFELLLEDCLVGKEDDSVGFKKISGSGVTNPSKLILDNTSLNVNGEVSGIGTLIYADTEEDSISVYEVQRGVSLNPTLKANGKMEVGNIELQTDGELIGCATVTRNKSKKITAVTPKITIGGEVTSQGDYKLVLDIQEYDKANEADRKAMRDLGLKLAKAEKATYPKIKAKHDEDSVLVKTGGYLTYFEDGYGVELSYQSEEDATVVIPCRSFADAVTEINNRKTKQEYIITLLEANTDISGANWDEEAEAPKALAMPNKNYVETLTIRADEEAEGRVEIGFLGDITLTSDVILKGVNFVQMIKSDSTYKRAEIQKDDYPQAVTLKVSGYDLTLEGNNTFNTPLVLNGGSKGTLHFDRTGTITTLTNDYDTEPDLTEDVIENVIFGSITEFKEVNVDGCNLALKEYASARNSTKFTASKNKMTTLNLRENGDGTGIITVVGQYAKGSLEVSNLTNDNGKILVGGKVQLKDVFMEGEQEPVISADLDFNITGTYTNAGDGTVLMTRLKGAGKAPYLNIAGKMERTEGTGPVTVKVLPESTATVNREEPITLITAGKTSAILLTAKNAKAGDFKPHSGNYEYGEYSSENTSGYMMFKSESNICVYEGKNVALGVYEGQEITENALVGYFPSIKEATSFVNSLKKAEQEYTYVLMEQNGSVTSPVTVSIPSYASRIILTSLENANNSQKTIYFSGGITLNTKLLMKDVILAPIKDKKGTSFAISAGNYDLELKDIAISNELPKMELGNISGKGKQAVVLDTNGLAVSGNISGTAKLVIKDNVTVNGAVKVTDLQMENAIRSNSNAEAVTLSVKGAVAVDDIHNYGSFRNVLEFTRTSKDITNLTINKLIENEAALLLLRQKDDSKVTALEKTGLQTVLSDVKKLAAMPQASTDSFEVEAKVGDVTYHSAENDTFRLVKANKGIYLADATLEDNIVTLTRRTSAGSVTETDCLDYAQAINEINTIADGASDYEIKLRAYADTSGEVDTVVTDKNVYSPFALPGSDKKNVLVVKNADSGVKVTVPFTGNISGYGTVTIQDVEFTPVKSGSDNTPEDTTLKIESDKTTQAPLFTLKNVSTKTTAAGSTSAKGFIKSITGTKNKTDVVLENCNYLILKSGISNVDEITLKDTKLLTAGASTINTMHMEDMQEVPTISSWDSLGKLTVNDIYMPAGVPTCYIGTKQDGDGKPQFVLSGEVKQGTVLCKVYKGNADITDADEIVTTASGTKAAKEVEKYGGTLLVSAKKASADRIRAYAFRDADAQGTIVENTEQITKGNLISYKTDVYVVNGNKANMAVQITEREGSEQGTIISTFYAESIDEAVTAINHKADMNSYYIIQFLQQGTKANPVVIKTTKNGTTYGGFTLPAKAKGVTVRGYEAVSETPEGTIVEPGTVIKYTGTLKASCDITFENILLTEGSIIKKPVNGNDFTEKGTITPVPASNVTITFEDKVFTVSDETKGGLVVNHTLGLASIDSGKGNVVLDGIHGVSGGSIKLRDLTLENGAVLETTDKVTLTNLYADGDINNKVATMAAMSIGTIGKPETENASGNVKLQTGFTKIKKNTEKPVTQLTISGEIMDVNVVINPWMYDLAAGAYKEVTEAGLSALSMKSDANPESYKKLANITKATLENISVIVDGMETGFTAYNEAYEGNEPQTYLYKYEKGLYFTNVKPKVKVTGYTAPEENEEEYAAEDICYRAEFLTWEQAVKEIDAIGNTKRYYKIELADNIGLNAEGTKVTAPIGTVTMPVKATEVKIMSESEKGIFFTKATISVKCPTMMENVGFTCVKKIGKGTNAYYEPVTYTMDTGNHKLTQKDMVNTFAGMETVPYTISGSAKGIFEVLSGEERGQSYAAVKKISTLIVKHDSELRDNSGYENFVLDCSGDISVKNLIVENCSVEAKNITVSELTTLDEAGLQAGTSAANDGKLTLKNIQLADNGNALTAKQNKSGATQITINGTVTAAEDAANDALADGTIMLKLYYNNYKKKLFWWVVDDSIPSKPAQLYDGMILCVAQKAEAELFVPAYTIEENEEMGIDGKDGMGLLYIGYGMYKSGKNICYGKTQ